MAATITKNSMRPINVLIADDHPVVREGLAAIVERREGMTVVGQAGNGQEAIALYRRHKPDITLMDLRMPQMDGTAAIAAIRAEFPNAAIIVLTTFDGDEDVYRGLRAGAKAFLLKDAPREELLEAICAVHAGQTYIPPEIASKLAARMGSRDLTPRETEVIHLMVAGKSNQEIANALYIAEGTVKAHVNSILSKLQVTDRTQAVMAALKRGLAHLDQA